MSRLIAFTLAVLFAGTAHAQTAITGKPDRIKDGDTLVIAGTSIRVWGIQAPDRGKPFYEESGVALRDFIDDRPVTCLYKGHHSWGRPVMQCRVDGVDIAAWIVRQGLAEDWPEYSGGHYAGDEAVARQAERGMWR